MARRPAYISYMRHQLWAILLLLPSFLVAQIPIKKVLIDGDTATINIEKCHAVVPQSDNTALLRCDGGRNIDIDDLYTDFIANNCGTFVEVSATNWTYPTGYSTIGISSAWVDKAVPSGSGSKVIMAVPKTTYTITQPPEYVYNSMIADLCGSGVGGGATNLSYTAAATQGTVVSDTGTDAVVPAVTGSNAGLALPAHKTKLDFISISQAVDLDAVEALAHAAMTVNEQVNGVDLSLSTQQLSVSLDPNELTSVAVASGDELIFGDISGSNAVRKTTAGAVANLFTEVDGSTTNELGEYTAQSSAPGSPKQGDLWHDTDGDTLFVYDAGAWVFAAIRAGGSGDETNSKTNWALKAGTSSTDVLTENPSIQFASLPLTGSEDGKIKMVNVPAGYVHILSGGAGKTIFGRDSLFVFEGVHQFYLDSVNANWVPINPEKYTSSLRPGIKTMAKTSGQSNSTGQGAVADLAAPYTQTIPWVKICDQYSGAWENLKIGGATANNNSFTNTTVGGGLDSAYCGPETGMIFEFAKQFPGDTLFLLKTGISGTAIKRHIKGGSLQDAYLQDSISTQTCLNLLLQREDVHTVDFRGDLWIQGESDAGSDSAAYTYALQLDTVITQKRRQMGAGLPIIFGEIGNFTDARKIVNNTLQGKSHLDADIYNLNSGDLPRLSAGDSHFNAAAQIEIGERFVRMIKGLPSYFITDTIPNLIPTFSETHTDDILFLFAMRLANEDYTGDCIRVRRKSDNTQTDIGFSGVELDTAAMKTFCGTGATDTCWVVTAYDQSLLGYDATQATESLQPLALASGVVVREGGKPALLFHKRPLYMSASAFAAVQAQPASFVYVAALDAAATGNNFIFDNYVSGGANRQYVGINTLGKWSINAGVDAVGTAAWDTNQNMFFGNMNGALSDLWLNNVAEISSGNAGTNGMSGMRIGTLTNSWLGTIQEIRYYSADKTGQRSLIQNNVNSYYSIY